MYYMDGLRKSFLLLTLQSALAEINPFPLTAVEMTKLPSVV
jgi:hypothetical protein